MRWVAPGVVAPDWALTGIAISIRLPLLQMPQQAIDAPAQLGVFLRPDEHARHLLGAGAGRFQSARVIAGVREHRQDRARAPAEHILDRAPQLRDDALDRPGRRV